MLIKDVPFSELRRHGRWKVEHFIGPVRRRRRSRYDLVRIDALVSERREFIDPRQFPETPLNYIGLEHVASVSGELVGFRPVPGGTIRSRSKVFRCGDVLYGRLRPYLNKVHLAVAPISEGACSGEFYVLTPNSPRVLPRYLRAMLASRYVQEVATSLQAGSTHPRLSLDDLMAIEIPCPPLDVQRKLEALLKAEAARYVAIKHQAAALPVAVINEIVDIVESGRSEVPRQVSLPGLTPLEAAPPLPGPSALA